MDTPQKARKFYNQFSQYEDFQKSEGWQIPNLLVRNTIPYLSRGQLMIDVGCGPGLVGVELEKMKWQGILVGIDIAEKRLKEARRKPFYNFCVHADANHLPFSDKTFDMVLSSATVGLTGIRSIQEMGRVLKPRGYLACSAGEIKSKSWCRKRFQETVSYLDHLPNAQIISRKDLGTGYTNEYDDEHYIYYLIIFD